MRFCLTCGVLVLVTCQLLNGALAGEPPVRVALSAGSVTGTLSPMTVLDDGRIAFVELADGAVLLRLVDPDGWRASEERVALSLASDPNLDVEELRVDGVAWRGGLLLWLSETGLLPRTIGFQLGHEDEASRRPWRLWSSSPVDFPALAPDAAFLFDTFGLTKLDAELVLTPLLDFSPFEGVRPLSCAGGAWVATTNEDPLCYLVQEGTSEERELCIPGFSLLVWSQKTGFVSSPLPDKFGPDGESELSWTASTCLNGKPHVLVGGDAALSIAKLDAKGRARKWTTLRPTASSPNEGEGDDANEDQETGDEGEEDDEDEEPWRLGFPGQPLALDEERISWLDDEGRLIETRFELKTRRFDSTALLEDSAAEGLFCLYRRGSPVCVLSSEAGVELLVFGAPPFSGFTRVEHTPLFEPPLPTRESDKAQPWCGVASPERAAASPLWQALRGAVELRCADDDGESCQPARAFFEAGTISMAEWHRELGLDDSAVIDFSACRVDLDSKDLGDELLVWVPSPQAAAEGELGDADDGEEEEDASSSSLVRWLLLSFRASEERWELSEASWQEPAGPAVAAAIAEFCATATNQQELGGTEEATNQQEVLCDGLREELDGDHRARYRDPFLAAFGHRFTLWECLPECCAGVQSELVRFRDRWWVEYVKEISCD